VIPKEFDYVAPSSVQEALAALRDGGEDAKVLAGGHSLIPLMKLRLAAPSRLVDLRNIADLHGLRGGPDAQVVIGSMVTYYELQALEQLKGFPVLGECAASIGDAQVRARGTIGGSLAHADPASDLPAAALALDAVLIAAHLNGGVTEREIPARDFFVDLLTTSLQPGEIITGVRLPVVQGRAGGAYVKIRNKASHYALAGAAVMLQVGDDGTCNNASIALTGVASRPFRLERAESALRGSKLEDSAIRDAANAANGADVQWMSDLFGSEEYRKHLAGVVATRAIETARGRLR
jgi:aerobic carbon-monoxide dehydrogenase medium subunit